MTISLDLPLPPSVNSIYQRTKGRWGISRSGPYKAWIKAAGKEIQAQRRSQEPVKGHFRSHLIFSQKKRKKNEDLDNKVKAVLDLLQAHQLIENDCLNDHMITEWNKAPRGCKVFVWPADEARL